MRWSSTACVTGADTTSPSRVNPTKLEHGNVADAPHGAADPGCCSTAAEVSLVLYFDVQACHRLPPDGVRFSATVQATSPLLTFGAWALAESMSLPGTTT